MFSAAFKNWQRSWGTALALLAVLSWCMPVLAMGCAVSAMPPMASLRCNMDMAGAPQMPCCQKIPVPATPSADHHSAFCCLDGSADLLILSFPQPHTPLWGLVIAPPGFTPGVLRATRFYRFRFFYPPSANADAPASGRAPPFLV